MVFADDVGSFPLPSWIREKDFNELYRKALNEDEESLRMLRGVVLESFEAKLSSGLDVVGYPQHYDMYAQFLEPVGMHQEEPYLIGEKEAKIIEVEIIKENAKELCEKFGKKIELKVCATGAVELYLSTEFGKNIYKDILENLAKSVNRFLKSALIKNNYIETKVVSIDEPSLGYADLLNVEKDDIVNVLEASAESIDVQVQLHLHTLKAIDIFLQAKNISIVTAEYASNPKNLELASKQALEKRDKFIRVGIARTDIDSVIAGFLEKGVEPNTKMLIDEKEEIKRRFEKAKEKFGERLLFAGPDCGLRSWPSQEAAGELLKRVSDVMHSHEK